MGEKAKKLFSDIYFHVAVAVIHLEPLLQLVQRANSELAKYIYMYIKRYFKIKFLYIKLKYILQK